MNYKGPKFNLNELPFTVDLLSTGGFIKVEYFKIHDGDTAVFKINKIRESVRLLVIDTPELEPNPAPFGQEAKDYFEYILTHAKEIYLESDIHSSFRDDTQKRRILAWLWVDGELVNYNLVRMGYAEVKYIESENLKYLSYLKEAEVEAKKENLRIFNEEDVCI